MPYQNEAAAAGAVTRLRIGAGATATYVDSFAGNTYQAAVQDRERGFLQAAEIGAGRRGISCQGRHVAASAIPMVIALCAYLVLLVTMVYGPIAAWLVELFPTRIRYSSMSLPYHIGNGWFGGFLPVTSFAIVAATGGIYNGLVVPGHRRERDRQSSAAFPARDARHPLACELLRRGSSAMFGIHDLGLFVVSGLLLNITPGVDFLYVLGRGCGGDSARGCGRARESARAVSCTSGRRARPLRVAGFVRPAFAVLKWLGAGYLVIMGVMMMRQRGGFRLDTPARAAAPIRAGVRTGPRHQCAESQGGAVLSRIRAAVHRRPQPVTKSPRSCARHRVQHHGHDLEYLLAWARRVRWPRRIDAAARVGRWLNRSLGGLFVVLGVRLALAERS